MSAPINLNCFKRAPQSNTQLYVRDLLFQNQICFFLRVPAVPVRIFAGVFVVVSFLLGLPDLVVALSPGCIFSHDFNHFLSISLESTGPCSMHGQEAALLTNLSFTQSPSHLPYGKKSFSYRRSSISFRLWLEVCPEWAFVRFEVAIKR